MRRRSPLIHATICVKMQCLDGNALALDFEREVILPAPSTTLIRT
jgi:hypothetical protein